jgi:hypothetical protein
MNNTEGYLKYLIPDISVNIKLAKKIVTQYSMRYTILKKLNWHEARQECRDRGMDLIMLDTQAKNDYMSNQLSKNH